MIVGVKILTNFGLGAICKMSIIFKDYTTKAEHFFAILPTDWQEDILPVWKNYKNNTKIFVLEENNIVIGGGMVFSTLSPDLQTVPKIAQKHYKNGGLYLAFIWIAETHRGKGFGTLWLNELIKLTPTQNYWLTIDDLKLKAFYENVGFKLGESYLNNGIEEWVLEYNS